MTNNILLCYTDKAVSTVMTNLVFMWCPGHLDFAIENGGSKDFENRKNNYRKWEKCEKTEFYWDVAEKPGCAYGWEKFNNPGTGRTVWYYLGHIENISVW